MAVDVTNEELVARLPGEPITYDNAAHYRGRLRRELLINKCTQCDTWHHPPKPLCPQCWSSDVVPIQVSGRGTIYTAIRLHQGPPAEGVDYSRPYPVVTVELDEQPGLRFTSTVVGAPEDSDLIGIRVSLEWADRNGSPMPVFRAGSGESA